MSKHIQDEAFLDRLFHRIAVEGDVSDVLPSVFRIPKNLKCFVFRRRRKREVAGILQHLPGFHKSIDLVLGRVLIVVFAGVTQRHGYRSGHLAALARMGFIDDDREPASLVFIADLVEHKGEFLDRRDDDLLTRRQKGAEICGSIRVSNDGGDLRELLYGVPYLTVQDPAIGNDNDRIDQWGVAFLKADQLVGKPCDGVRLPAAGRVLDQIAPADS